MPGKHVKARGQTARDTASYSGVRFPLFLQLRHPRSIKTSPHSSTQASFSRRARLEDDDRCLVRASCRVTVEVLVEFASAATAVRAPRRLRACRARRAGCRLPARRPLRDRPAGSATRPARTHPSRSSPSRPVLARPRSSTITLRGSPLRRRVVVSRKAPHLGDASSRCRRVDVEDRPASHRRLGRLGNSLVAGDPLGPDQRLEPGRIERLHLYFPEPGVLCY